jgi:hypothetical protein
VILLPPRVVAKTAAMALADPGGTLAAEFPDDGGTRFVVLLPRLASIESLPSSGYTAPRWTGATAGDLAWPRGFG